jgi:hypothetical protein
MLPGAGRGQASRSDVAALPACAALQKAAANTAIKAIGKPLMRCNWDLVGKPATLLRLRYA